LITAIGVEFHQERIPAEHGRHHECAAVAILNVSSMNDGMNQQALRIDENVPLLALDLLSRVVARRVNRSPLFQRGGLHGFKNTSDNPVHLLMFGGYD
jgi:hypothetical protein